MLDEQNIPETGRWLVIPPWVAALIKKSDLRNASISGDGVSLMRNGRLGMIDRFTLYSSNLLPTATEGATNAFRIFAGHPHGLTFASPDHQDGDDAFRERSFSTLLRGLQVYGCQGARRHRDHRAVLRAGITALPVVEGGDPLPFWRCYVTNRRRADHRGPAVAE